MDQRNPISAPPSAPPLPQQTMSLWPLCISIFTAIVVMEAVVALLVHFSTLASRQFQVQFVTTPTPFTFTFANSTTTTALTASFDITLEIVQPYFGPLEGPANVSVYYHKQHPENKKTVVNYYLGSSSLNSFCPGRTSCDQSDVRRLVRIAVVAQVVPVSDELTAFLMDWDLKQGEFTITIEILGNYLVDSAAGGLSTVQFRVICEGVKIDIRSGAMMNSPGKCKLNIPTEL